MAMYISENGSKNTQKSESEKAQFTRAYTCESAPRRRGKMIQPTKAAIISENEALKAIIAEYQKAEKADKKAGKKAPARTRKAQVQARPLHTRESVDGGERLYFTITLENGKRVKAKSFYNTAKKVVYIDPREFAYRGAEVVRALLLALFDYEWFGGFHGRGDRQAILNDRHAIRTMPVAQLEALVC